MKKFFTVMLCAALVLGVSLPGLAIELTPEAAGMLGKATTAYSPNTINAILEAQGLSLNPDAVSGVPASYAKVADGKVVFGTKSTAYSPDLYHSIFTAYGLTLSPEAVQEKLGATNYAKVADGKIVFGTKSTAYAGETLKTILSAYELPAMGMAPTPTVTPTPAPTPAPVGPTDSDGDKVSDDMDKCPGTPPGAKVDERGCWVLYINFDFDKSVVKPEFYGALDEVVQILNDNPSVVLEVEGHTDSIGTNAYNQKLSERRASAVKNYLVKKGIGSDRLSAVGYGEERPIADNATKEGRAKNRRVELTPKF